MGTSYSGQLMRTSEPGGSQVTLNLSSTTIGACQHRRLRCHHPQFRHGKVAPLLWDCHALNRTWISIRVSIQLEKAGLIHLFFPSYQALHVKIVRLIAISPLLVRKSLTTCRVVLNRVLTPTCRVVALIHLAPRQAASGALMLLPEFIPSRACSRCESFI